MRITNLYKQNQVGTKKKITAILITVMLCTSSILPFSISSSAKSVKIVNVTSYGAKGDDKKDDTDAFQKALDLAKSVDALTINVPAGNYYIGKPENKSARSLKIHSNTTLNLDKNAVIYRQKSAQNRYILETKVGTSEKNISITGGTWNGNVYDTKIAKGIISFTDADDINLSNMNFCNVCGTHFVLLNGIQTLTVNNCTFKDFKLFSGTQSEYNK